MLRIDKPSTSKRGGHVSSLEAFQGPYPTAPSASGADAAYAEYTMLNEQRLPEPPREYEVTAWQGRCSLRMLSENRERYASPHIYVSPLTPILETPQDKPPIGHNCEAWSHTRRLHRREDRRLGLLPEYHTWPAGLGYVGVKAGVAVSQLMTSRYRLMACLLVVITVFWCYHPYI